MSLSRESPFSHKVVYSVDDGCSLWQKSIVLNGWPFLRCSIVWRQICWIDYRTPFEELMSENKSTFALRKRWSVSVLNCTKNLLVSSTPSPIKCLVTKLRTNRKVYQVLYVVCKFYWEMDRNEKYWNKNARGTSNLCLSRMFLLLES